MLLGQVLNKIDLLGEAEIKELVGWFTAEGKSDVVIPISAKAGTGVKEVRQWASDQLPPGPSLYSKVHFALDFLTHTANHS